jgi:hypothetical protein
MDEPVVEEVITENLSQALENLEKSPDIVEKPPAKKNGRPQGSKDSVKRVVKPRKITIVETPLHAEETAIATSASSSGDVPVVVSAVEPAIASKAPRIPKPQAVLNAEPEVRYVDRYIEHSPRTSIRIAHGHLANEQKLRVDERKEHFSNQMFNRLR